MMMLRFKNYLNEELNSEFWEWFQNSKVVDKNGNPLPVYKGLFKKNWRNGKDIDSINSPDKPWAGYFTSDKNVAQSFASNFKNFFPKLGSQVLSFYLSLQNPLIVDGQNKYAKEFMLDGDIGSIKPKYPDTEIYRAISGNKYDGVIIKNTKDEADIYITKYPNQSKLISNTKWNNQDDRFSYDQI